MGVPFHLSLTFGSAEMPSRNDTASTRPSAEAKCSALMWGSRMMMMRRRRRRKRRRRSRKKEEEKQQQEEEEGESGSDKRQHEPTFLFSHDL